jgi:hypothetical protein
LPNPWEVLESSAKTVDAWLPGPLPDVFLDDKGLEPQCQKMVSIGDLC